MLALDLGVFHRGAHVVKVREAMLWSVAWIAMAAVFAVVVFFWHGHKPALEFVTGYVIELSLSVDNLFVFLLIFRFFKVSPEHQHRVLFWGIIGALVMRAIFILVGVGLISRFAWVTYLFGALLLFSGIKLFLHKESEIHPEHNPVLSLVRKLVPVTKDYEGGKFFVQRAGLYATPLFVVLIVVETTDVAFAVDSIPAVLAITLNAFLHFERIRHYGPALHVFRASWIDGDVSLSSLRALVGVEFYRCEDAHRPLRGDSHSLCVGWSRRDFIGFRAGIHSSSGQENSIVMLALTETTSLFRDAFYAKRTDSPITKECFRNFASSCAGKSVR